MSWTCPSCAETYAEAPADTGRVNGCPECGRWLDPPERDAPMRLAVHVAVVVLGAAMCAAIFVHAWGAAAAFGFTVLVCALMLSVTR